MREKLVFEDADGTKRFRFARFSEKLGLVDVDVLHRVHDDIGNSAPDRGAWSSHFLDMLTQQRSMNKTAHFSRFIDEVSPMTLSLPQLLHHKQEVIHCIVRHLKVPESLARIPLLRMLSTLARDLRGEFFPFLNDVFQACVDILETNDLQDHKLLEELFSTLAYIFKFLTRELVIELPGVFKYFTPLLGHKAEFVRGFAAESIAFLLRKVSEENIHKFLQLFFTYTYENSSPELYDGFGTMLFEAIKGVQHRLHTRGVYLLDAVLRVALEWPEDSQLSEKLQADDLFNRYISLTRCMEQLRFHVKSNTSADLWKLFDTSIQTRVRSWMKTAESLQNQMDDDEKASLSHDLHLQSIPLQRTISIFSDLIAFNRGGRIHDISAVQETARAFLQSSFLTHPLQESETVKLGFACAKNLMDLDRFDSESTPIDRNYLTTAILSAASVHLPLVLQAALACSSAPKFGTIALPRLLRVCEQYLPTQPDAILSFILQFTNNHVAVSHIHFAGQSQSKVPVNEGWPEIASNSPVCSSSPRPIFLTKTIGTAVFSALQTVIAALMSNVSSISAASDSEISSALFDASSWSLLTSPTSVEWASHILSDQKQQKASKKTSKQPKKKSVHAMDVEMSHDSSSSSLPAPTLPASIPAPVVWTLLSAIRVLEVDISECGKTCKTFVKFLAKRLAFSEAQKKKSSKKSAAVDDEEADAEGLQVLDVHDLEGDEAFAIQSRLSAQALDTLTNLSLGSISILHPSTFLPVLFNILTKCCKFPDLVDSVRNCFIAMKELSSSPSAPAVESAAVNSFFNSIERHVQLCASPLLRMHLRSPIHNCRFTALGILDLFTAPSYISAPVAPSSSKAASSLAGPSQVLSFCFQIESMDIDYRSIQAMTLHFKRIKSLVDGNHVPEAHLHVLAVYCIGALFIKLSAVWPEIHQIIQAIAGLVPDVLWSSLLSALEHFSGAIQLLPEASSSISSLGRLAMGLKSKKSAEEVEKEAMKKYKAKDVAEGDEEAEDEELEDNGRYSISESAVTKFATLHSQVSSLTQLFIDSASLVEDRTNRPTIVQQLWSCLQLVPDIASSHLSDILPLFYDFMRFDINIRFYKDDAFQWNSSISRRFRPPVVRNQQIRKTLLTTILEVMHGMRLTKLSADSTDTSTLASIFRRLISLFNEARVQSLALECYLTLQPYCQLLKPFASELLHLTSDTEARSALTTFSPSFIDENVKPHQRSVLEPLLVAILLPRISIPQFILRRAGKRNIGRSILLNYFGGLSETAHTYLMRRLMNFMFNDIPGDFSLSSIANLPVHRIRLINSNLFLEILGDAFQAFAKHLTPFLPDLASALFYMARRSLGDATLRKDESDDDEDDEEDRIDELDDEYQELIQEEQKTAKEAKSHKGGGRGGDLSSVTGSVALSNDPLTAFEFRIAVLNRVSSLFDRFPHHSFQKPALDSFLSASSKSLDRIPRTNFDRGSALLSCFASWAHHPNLLPLYVQYPQVFQAFLLILTAPGVAEPVVTIAFNVLEAVLGHLDDSLISLSESASWLSPDLRQAGVTMRTHCLVSHTDMLLMAFQSLISNTSILALDRKNNRVKKSEKDEKKKLHARMSPLGQRLLSLLVTLCSACELSPSQATTVYSIMIPFVSKHDKIAWTSLSSILDIMCMLIPRLAMPSAAVTASGKPAQPHFYYSMPQLSRLILNPVLPFNLRTSLSKVFHAMATVDSTMTDVARFLKLVNTASRNSLDEPDYDSRVEAFTLLTTQVDKFTSASPLSEAPVILTSATRLMPVFCQIVMLLREDDMSVRSLAANSIKVVISSVAEYLKLSSGQQSVQLQGQYKVLFRDLLVPAMYDAILSPSLNARKESAILLGFITALFPTDFSGFTRLLNAADVDSDFFHNLGHVSVAKRASALTSLRGAIEEGKIPVEDLKSLFIPLLRKTLYDCVYSADKKQRAKDSQMDATAESALLTLRAIASRCEWKQYMGLMTDMSNMLTKHPEMERLVVKAQCAILDSFHFAVADTVSVPGENDVALEALGIAVHASYNKKNSGYIKRSGRITIGEEQEIPGEEGEEGEQAAAAAAQPEPVLEKKAKKTKKVDDDDEEDQQDDEEDEEEDDDEEEFLEEMQDAMDEQGDGAVASNSRRVSRRRTITMSAVANPEKVRSDILKTVLPKMYAFLKGDGDKVFVRSSMAVSIVKCLRVLPASIRDAHLPAVLGQLCADLKSRVQKTRHSSRSVLSAVLNVFGPSMLPFLIENMSALLIDGFQRNVLSYTVFQLVQSLEKNQRLKAGSLDDSSMAIMKIAIEESFGQLALEKMEKGKQDNQPIESSVGIRPQELVRMVSRYLTFTPANVQTVILKPINTVAAASHKRRVVERCTQLLTYATIGFTHNETALMSDTFILVHSLLKDSVEVILQPTEKKSVIKSRLQALEQQQIQRVTSDETFVVQAEPEHQGAIVEAVGKRSLASERLLNLNVTTEFALALLNRRCFQHKKLESKVGSELTPQQFRAMLDPLVPILARCLHTKYVGTLTLCLQVITQILNMSLPSLELHMSDILERLFSIAQDAGPANVELWGSTFSMMAELLHKYKGFQLKVAHAQVMAALVKLNIEDEKKQGSALRVLRALVDKKINIPEIYELMPIVGDLFITSQSVSVRRVSSEIFLTFLLEYAIGKTRVVRYLEFIIKNLEYKYEKGRLAVLQMLQAILTRFPAELLAERSELLFCSMAVRLNNDDSIDCRREVSKALNLLFSRSEGLVLDRLIMLMQTWFSTLDNAKLQRLAAQCVGILVEAQSSMTVRIRKTFIAHLLAALSSERSRNDLPELEAANAEAPEQKLKAAKKDEEDDSSRKRSRPQEIDDDGWEVVGPGGKTIEDEKMAQEEQHEESMEELPAEEEERENGDDEEQEGKEEMRDEEADAKEEDHKEEEEAEEEEEQSTAYQPKFVHAEWDVAYYSLLAIEKMVAIDPKCLVVQSASEMMEAVENVLLHPHFWVRLASARVLGSYLAHHDPTTLLPISQEAAPSSSGKKQKIVPSAYLSSEGTLSRLASASIHQLIGKYGDPQFNVQILKNLVFLGRCMAARQAQVNVGGLRPFELLMDQIAEIGATGNSYQRTASFKFIAAISAQVPSKLLQPALHSIIDNLYRVTADATTIALSGKVKKLAEQVLEILQTVIGVKEFTTVYQAVRNDLMEKRANKKRKLAIQTVANPKKAAAAKLSKNSKKKE